MTQIKPDPGERSMKKAAASPVRSSAAEYLTVLGASDGSGVGIEKRYEDENIWLTPKMIAELCGVSVPAVNQHLKRIFSDNGLEAPAVVKQCLITAAVRASNNWESTVGLPSW